LALAGRRVRSSACLAAALRAGTGTPPNLSLWISRDGRVRELLLTPDPPAVQRWHLERDPLCSAEAQNRRQRWCRLLP